MRKAMGKKRVQRLKYMDNFVRDCTDTDEALEYWLENGIPDDEGEQDLLEMALIDDIYIDILETFVDTLKYNEDLNEENFRK